MKYHYHFPDVITYHSKKTTGRFLPNKVYLIRICIPWNFLISDMSKMHLLD